MYARWWLKSVNSELFTQAYVSFFPTPPPHPSRRRKKNYNNRGRELASEQERYVQQFSFSHMCIWCCWEFKKKKREKILEKEQEAAADWMAALLKVDASVQHQEMALQKRQTTARKKRCGERAPSKCHHPHRPSRRRRLCRTAALHGDGVACHIFAWRM